MAEQKKIFILDDEEEILELLERILGSQYQVYTKKDTENLEEELVRFQPNVIMIDHFIGDRTSKDLLLDSIRALDDVPVILHSAHEDIEKLSIDTKVTAFLRKPSGIHEIRQCVADVLANRD